MMQIISSCCVKGGYDKSLKLTEDFYSASIIEADKKGFLNLLSVFYNREKSAVYYFLGDYNKSISCKILELENEQIIGRGRTRTIIISEVLAFIYLKKGDFTNALDMFFKCIEESKSNLRRLRKCYINLAFAYFKQGDFKQSANINFEVCKYQYIEGRYGEKYGMSIVLLGVGLSYFYLSEIKTAEEYIQKAKTDRKNARDADFPKTGNIFIDIAIEYALAGDYKKASYYYEYTFHIHQFGYYSKNKELAYNYFEASKIYLDMGKYDMALNFINKAILFRENIYGKNAPETKELNIFKNQITIKN